MSKQLVRKGLFPDHREPKTWLQWGIGLFMSLYPCCLRGWRVWASGIFFVFVFISMIFSIIYAVRRYRSRKTGYKKVETDADVPLDNMVYRDDFTVHDHLSEADQR